MTLERAPRYVGILIGAVLASLMLLPNSDPCGSTPLPWAFFGWVLAPGLAFLYALPQATWRAYWTNGMLAVIAMAATAAIYSLPLENTGPCESPLHAGWHARLLFSAIGGVISLVVGALLALAALAIRRRLRGRPGPASSPVESEKGE